MAGTTSNRSWPYPESSDFVADGATAIENLADAIDGSIGRGVSYVQTVGFTSSGTFTKATYPWLRAVRVRLVGGGAGGGGCSTSTCGGGGGGGGYRERFIGATTLAASITVTVGAGGSGGAGGSPGGNGLGGGDSEFAAGTAYEVLGYGGNGTANSGRTGGLGGGGVGEVGYDGGDGASGGSSSTAAGNGGSSHLGGGGRGAPQHSPFVGQDGNIRGGGGGGGSSGGTSTAAGGDGASGIVLVDLYA